MHRCECSSSIFFFLKAKIQWAAYKKEKLLYFLNGSLRHQITCSQKWIREDCVSERLLCVCVRSFILASNNTAIIYSIIHFINLLEWHLFCCLFVYPFEYKNIIKVSWWLLAKIDLDNDCQQQRRSFIYLFNIKSIIVVRVVCTNKKDKVGCISK